MDNPVSEDIGRLLRNDVGRARDHFEVAVLATGRDVVGRQLFLGEVNHHRARVVHHQVNTRVVVLLPVLVVHRHVGLVSQESNRIDDVDRSGVLHGLTLRHRGGIVGYIRQHLHEQGIVEHRRVEQLFLHGLRQVVILAHAPAIAGEEPIKRLIVGREHSLRACFAQCLGIAQVIDEPHIVAEGSCEYLLTRTAQRLRILQGFIDTATQP